MKTCCGCRDTKELKLFYVNSAMKDGYSARCKKCYRNNVFCKMGRPLNSTRTPEEITNSKSKAMKDSWLEIRLANTSKKDYVETYEFLKRIGYKLDESIHEQFCSKHDLTPTEPQTFTHHYSAKACGMA